MADLVRTTTPRARIPHRCHFCSTTINPGDTYHRSVTPTVAREVCDRCWLEKSITGECGCEP